MRAELVEGAGNRFVLVDAWERAAPADASELARGACAQAGADGLLVLTRADGADVGMLVHNADGSRAEACGNGLRCLALRARERGRVGADELVVATDCGPRRVSLLREPSGLLSGARAQMGPAAILEHEARFELPGGECVSGARVRVGNPHLVLAVEDERTARVAELGPALARHPRSPEGANVGFLAQRADGLHLRVWERGVGETAACGSGACAAALVAHARGWCAWPARVAMPGGVLTVGLDARGEPWLEGPVRFLGELELDDALVRDAAEAAALARDRAAR